MKSEKLRSKLILGIETSCDETSAAVVRDGREVLSDVISSQIEIHRRFGGVVPEIASRNHTSAVMNIIGEALNQAKATLSDISAIAVTYGPGLIGALLVGVSAAKALAYAANIPLIAVPHTKAHIAANFIAHKDLEPPFVCLVVSGGHTSIYLCESYLQYKLLGTTADDACGEAFDKVARVLGLPYPGGPEIEKLAAQCPAPSIEFFKSAVMDSGKDFNFSYSGLKTAVINYINTQKMKGISTSADIAASFQSYAIAPLVSKTIRAAREYGVSKIAVCGGVAANSFLRLKMQEACQKNNLKAYFPPPRLCTDNAAMVASLGYYMLQAGEVSGLDLNAKAVL